MGKVFGPFSYTTVCRENTTRTMSPLKYMRHVNKCELLKKMRQSNEKRNGTFKNWMRVISSGWSLYITISFCFLLYNSFIHPFKFSLIPLFIHSLILSIPSPIHIDSVMHSFIHSVIQWFIHSFVYSFIH